MKTKTHFERAVFLSWYCSRGDCKFCYMSTQKNLIKNPKKARRSFESIIAEVFLCRKLGWKIEFLSGGYESFSTDELALLFEYIYKVYGEKVWLNIGVLSDKELERFKPYIKGVCGAVECVNESIHKDVCPSKPLNEIEDMFKSCEELSLKKAMTTILGIGESLSDISLLKKYIKKNSIDKITFYRLKPQKNTCFENAEPISEEYYENWVKEIRKEFPKIKITVGSWITHLNEIHMLLNAGADAITKFPSIKWFNSKYSKQIEEEARIANRSFEGSLTVLPDIDVNEIDGFDIPSLLKDKVKVKIKEYVKSMKKEKNK